MEDKEYAIKRYIKNNNNLYNVLYPMVNSIRRLKGIYLQTCTFYAKYFLRSFNIIKTDPIIHSLKDLYKGRRMFIVATGPSLKNSDLEWLKDNNELTISCNGIFKLYDKTTWRPHYYVMDDYYLYDDYKKKGIDLNLEKMALKKTLLSEPIQKKIEYVYDKNKIGFFPICYFDHWFTNRSKHYKYNKNILLGHFDMYTVTNTAINLAHYMGAKEIILLGVDCNFSQSILHSGETKKINLDYQNAKEMECAQKLGYMHMAIAFKKEKTKIFNATRGGNLEIFPRKSMDEFVNEICD